MLQLTLNYLRTLFIISLSTVLFFGCNKYDAEPNSKNHYINTAIANAQAYVNRNPEFRDKAEKLDWNSILISVSIAKNGPMKLSVPLTNGRQVDEYSTFYVDSIGQIDQHLILNVSSLNEAVDDEYRRIVSDGFKKMKNKGYDVPEVLLAPSEQWEKEQLSFIKKQNQYLSPLTNVKLNNVTSPKKADSTGIDRHQSFSNTTSNTVATAGSCSATFNIRWEFWHSCNSAQLYDLHYLIKEHFITKIRQLLRSEGHERADVIQNFEGLQVINLNPGGSSVSTGAVHSTVRQIANQFQFPNANNCVDLMQFSYVGVENAQERCQNTTTPTPGTPPAPNPNNPPTNEMIVDSLNKKHPCVVSTVIEPLFSELNLFTTMIMPFMSVEYGRPNLIWDAQPLAYGGSNNQYMLGNSQGQGYSSTITLNSQAINNASKLYVAATVIHETVHAYTNYLIKSGKYGQIVSTLPLNTWGITVEFWAQLDSLHATQANYIDHYNFLETYYDNMVSSLTTSMGSSYTLKECRMAMIYGMNNPGGFPPNSPEAIKLNATYNKILNKYNITASELNNFNRDNLINVPVAKKVPSNCPEI